MANDFLLIIDGSGLLSTQYYGNLPKEVLYAKTEEEKEQFYYKLMKTSSGVFTNGVFGFVKTLISILQYQQPKYLAVCWDVTRDTFRKTLYDDYKANRKMTPMPLSEQFALCQRFLNEIGVAQFYSEEYEADDYAGSLSARFKGEVPVSVMTKDRDYLQLVDEQVSMWLMTSSAAKAQELYRKHGVKQEDYIVPDNMFYLTPELVKEEYGFAPGKTVMVKAFAGDSADNIPGVKGIGEKTAIALANAFDSCEQIYDTIRDLSDKELNELKKVWKEEYGISRSPFKYLLAKSEEELVGERGAMISKELATIKRDIPLPDISLDNLKTKLKADAFTRMLHELEFQSLSIGRISEEFFSGTNAVKQRELAVVMPAYSEKDSWVLKACESERLALSILVTDGGEPEPKKGQIDLFEYMKGQEKTEICDTVSEAGICALALSFHEGQAVLFTEQNGYDREALKEILCSCYNSGTMVIAFDAKEHFPFLHEECFEQFILKDSRESVDIFDLSVAAYLLNPLKSRYSTPEICQDYGETVEGREELIGKSKLSELSEDKFTQLLKICAQEAEMALKVQETLQRELMDKGMHALYCEIEMPTRYTLYEMEKNGVIADRNALLEYGDKLMITIQRLEQSIYKQAGHEFNIQSPKQLGVVLFEEMNLPAKKKTKTGYSTNAEVLNSLKAKAPIVADILEYRQLTKLHSTYAQGLSAYIQKDGRIHGKFHQTVTATGRISSTEPNLQNIPMRTDLGRAIRKVFLPAKGCQFVDADYSQIELRILAHMSGDEQLLHAFESGQDIHALTASQVFHVPFDEVTPLMRRNAKAVNFGIVYGISAHGLSEDLGISRKEAAEYMDSYFASYPKIKDFLDGLVEEGKKTGMVRTLYGRIRPIPEIHSTNFNQRSFGERVAMNSPIQGTAADIMKLAMLRTYRSLKKKGLASKLVLQIHDELVVEAVEEELNQVKDIVMHSMQDAAKLAVPLEVDLHVGTTWYDAK